MSTAKGKMDRTFVKKKKWSGIKPDLKEERYGLECLVLTIAIVTSLYKLFGSENFVLRILEHRYSPVETNLYMERP